MDKIIAIDGKWHLTREWVIETFRHNPYRDDGTLDDRIKLNTEVVYQGIFMFTASCNEKIIEKALLSENGKAFMVDILIAQLRADAKNGYNDLLYSNPMDLRTGNFLDPSLFYRAILCPMAYRILENSGKYFDGVSLMFRTTYTPREVDILCGR